jgi:predicted deacylase
MRSRFNRFAFLGSAALAALSTGPYAQAAPITLDHDYHEVQAYVAQLAQTYPQNASLIEIGVGDNGESIVGLKIGNGAVHNLIVGTHHGNEYGSTEVALGAALDLAKSPIAGETIYVIPVLNITGYDANRREEALGSDLLDANRDYPGPCATSGPFRLKSTKALADFIAQENIVASATLHTYGPQVLYPWGISTADTKTAYDTQFMSLAQTAAATSGYAIVN